MLRVWKWIGWLLCVAGSAIGGFPPPRAFEPEPVSEPQIVQILDEFVPEDGDVSEIPGVGLVLRDEPASPGTTRLPMDTTYRPV